MLVVTIHDVAPPMLPAVTRLRELIGRWGVERVTLLAVPNFHGEAPLAEHAATRTWLRQRAEAGDEIALHGLRHVQSAPASAIGSLRARLFTAGEGEMLGAGAADPKVLKAARHQLAEIAGAPIRGFVAPAWLEPPGFADLLAQLGFGWHETGLMLERLTDRTQLTSPVIGYATRTRIREAAALAWSRLLAPVANRLAALGRPARIALHPGDLMSSAVLAEAERAIRKLVRSHRAVTTAVAVGLGA